MRLQPEKASSCLVIQFLETITYAAVTLAALPTAGTVPFCSIIFVKVSSYSLKVFET
jgi:hypothetical protein